MSYRDFGDERQKGYCTLVSQESHVKARPCVKIKHAQRTLNRPQARDHSKPLKWKTSGGHG